MVSPGVLEAWSYLTEAKELGQLKGLLGQLQGLSAQAGGVQRLRLSVPHWGFPDNLLSLANCPLLQSQPVFP